MKRIVKKLHLWLSIPVGLIISIICFSGAMLVFETEIMELCYPNRYFVKEVKAEAIPIGRLLAEVAKTLPDSVSITGVNIPSDPKRAYRVGLSHPRRASVAVDQYTGQVQERTRRAPFFTVMMRTHRWLLDSMKPGGGVFWGKVIVGTSTLLFVIILITGIVIWWPRTLKALKNTLKISVRKGWRRFWYDLHVAGGMYVLIALLAMSLTGLTWSFPWYRAGFYKMFGVEVRQGSGHAHGAPQGGGQRGENRDSREEGAYKHWQKIYNQLNVQHPEHTQISISAGSANVSFNKYSNLREADRYTFEPTTGEITGSTLYKDLEKPDKIRGWMYAVHVGNWGGLLTRILTFMAALIGGTLPLTGYYLWIKRSVKKKRRREAMA